MCTCQVEGDRSRSSSYFRFEYILKVIKVHSYHYRHSFGDFQVCFWFDFNKMVYHHPGERTHGSGRRKLWNRSCIKRRCQRLKIGLVAIPYPLSPYIYKSLRLISLFSQPTCNLDTVNGFMSPSTQGKIAYLFCCKLESINNPKELVKTLINCWFWRIHP